MTTKLKVGDHVYLRKGDSYAMEGWGTLTEVGCGRSMLRWDETEKMDSVETKDLSYDPEE